MRATAVTAARKTAMFRTHPLEAGVSLIFTQKRDLEDRRDAGTFYIGLGDEFDDDRRLVHAHWSGHIGRTQPGRRAKRPFGTNILKRQRQT